MKGSPNQVAAPDSGASALRFLNVPCVGLSARRPDELKFHKPYLILRNPDFAFRVFTAACLLTLFGLIAVAGFFLSNLASGSAKKNGESAVMPTRVVLELANAVGSRPLHLDTDTYTTAAGDEFRVSAFKYYLSNLRFRRADGSTYAVPNSYFLVDQAKPASHRLSVENVPAGDYTALSFTVGVDSARTKAGNLTGVLDANNGMWWEWSEEFINVKLEGTSPQSPSRGLVFHIAGFKGGNGANNTIRTVSVPFAATRLPIRPGHVPVVRLHVDVLGLFGAPNPVRFATTYNRMAAPATVLLADNVAAGMFSVENVQAN